VAAGRRILHDLADLRTNEIRSRVVRRIVGQQIAKRGAKSQTACFPGRFVQGLPFLRGRLKRGAIDDLKRVAVDGGVHHLPDFLGVLLDVALELRRERRVASRDAVVRGALEDDQMRGGLGDYRRSLDAG
jgi:hypothetical protein